MSHKAEDTIKKLLTALGVHDFSIVLKEEDGRFVYEVSTKEEGLIGEEGEVLRALNTLLKRIVEKEVDLSYSQSVSIDINGYEKEKQAVLIAQAEELAERVRTHGHEVEMNPMNSYQRMIVHNALKDVSGIRTESRGEGFERRVVICKEE